MIKAFINANRKVAAAITKLLKIDQRHLFGRYSETIANRLNHSSKQIVVDLGAGKRTLFAEYLTRPHSHLIIGVDISADEMIANPDLQAKCTANIGSGLPFVDNSVDLLVSHDLLEHIDDPKLFFSESKRILKPGGFFIHLLPSKFAPFALINQCLPSALSKRILSSLFSESRGIGGFPARYRLCYYSAIRTLMSKNELRAGRIITINDQSAYFGFFLPFFLISVLYEWVVQKVGIKNLASHLVIIATKM